LSAKGEKGEGVGDINLQGVPQGGFRGVEGAEFFPKVLGKRKAEEEKTAEGKEKKAHFSLSPGSEQVRNFLDPFLVFEGPLGLFPGAVPIIGTLTT